MKDRFALDVFGAFMMVVCFIGFYFLLEMFA